MRQFLLILVLTLFDPVAVPAQDTDYVNVIIADLDRDKRDDTFRICPQNSGICLAYRLSSMDFSEMKSGTLESLGESSALKIRDGVVSLTNLFMRGSNVFKFRYDSKTGDFLVIGYDNTQMGNAAGDGSGSSSYNLLTGVYKAQWYYWDEERRKLEPRPAISEKLEITPYKLQDFGESLIEEFYQLDFRLYETMLLR